ncbi:MAG: hypothetical protein ABJ056_09710 [Halioglobus sp.]
MDMVIISIVSLAAIAGHVWIYRWVKFKVHEGAIVDILSNNSSLCDADIAVKAHLQVDRVNTVCERSKQITPNGSGHWQCSPEH